MSRLTWLLVLFAVAICLVQVVAACVTSPLFGAAASLTFASAADDDEDLLKGTADAAPASSGPIAVKATLEVRRRRRSTAVGCR